MFDFFDVKILASGSSGNCYRVSDGHTSVLLDAGIPISRIRDALGHRLQDIAGCLITHEHGDHIKAAKDLAAAAISVYGTRGTFKAKKLYGWRYKAVTPLVPFFIGTMRVMAIPTEHDAAEPVAYMIDSFVSDPDHGQRLIYITDTYYFRYMIGDVHVAMIECNYDDDVLQDNIRNGSVHTARAKRTYSSHMSLDTVIKTVKSFGKSLQVVYLLHLSDANADAKKMVAAVEQATGVRVYVA